MRNLLIFIATLSIFTGIAVSAPTISITDTDAPGSIPSANLFLIKNYDASHLYAGNMLINIVDDGTFATKSFSNSAQFSFEYEVWSTTIRTNPKEGSATLTWGVDVGFTATGNSTMGATYQLWIQEDGILPGSEGHAVFLKIDDYSNDYYTTNYANYIPVQDSTLGSNIQMTAPVEADNGNNFLGIDDYTLVADGVTSGNLGYYVGIGSNTLRQLHEVYFYGTTDAGEDASADNLLATALIDGSSNISALANFAASGNRTNRIRPYGYDPAGNEYAGTDSAELLGGSKKWLALGQFGDDSLFGDNLIAGNWLAGTDYVSAGNSVDLLFFQTDFYGQRLLTATSGTNIDIVTSSMNATTSLSGNAPTSAIPLASQDAFSTSANGTVEYLDLVTFYKQESITIKPQITGATDVYVKESPVIVVKHNLINDVVFALSSDISSNSGNAVMYLEPALTNAVAGNTYSVNVVAIDAYQNITITPEFGTGGNVTVTGNFNPGYANGYVPFGGTALMHTPSYSSDHLFSGNAGILDINDITLYRSESNTLILGATIPAAYGMNGNTSNDNLNLNVLRNGNDIRVFFDDDDDHTNGLLASTNVTHTGGNQMGAGNTYTFYGIVSDNFGNPDTANNTDFITVAANTNSGNQMHIAAYRNDATNLSATATAIAGNLTFTNIRADHATYPGSGNSLVYPYSSLGLYATGANVTLESLTPAFVVSANTASTNVFFTTSGNIPVPYADVVSGNFITGATAGNSLNLYAGIGDQFGNVDINASSNMITLVTTLLNDAPDGTTAPGNVSSVDLSTREGAGDFTIIPVDYQTNASLSVTLNGSSNTINEVAGTFTVAHNSATHYDFVDSTGVYGSGNAFSGSSFSGNFAGNTFLLYVGALDLYKNTAVDYSGSDVTLSVNSTSSSNVSPYGDLSVLATETSFSAGNMSVNVLLYDADPTTVIDITGGSLTLNSSPSFVVNSNPTNGNRILFLDVADISNDDLSGNVFDGSSSSNVITSLSTPLTAGTEMPINLAYTDLYGNLETFGTIPAADNVNLAAGLPLPADSDYNDTPIYGSGGNTLNSNAIATVGLTLFHATSSSVGVVGTSAGNTFTSSTLSVTVNDAGASDVEFVTSAGLSGNTNPATVNDASAPIGVGVLGEPLDDIYIGFVDIYGNIDSDYTTGTVTVGSSSANVATANAVVTGDNVTIGVSGNRNASGLVYFDPGDSNKEVVITALNSGNAVLDVYSTGLSKSGNSNSFFLGDSVPPSVSVTWPNGGEELYPGTFNIGWSASDNNIGGNGMVTISLSLDGGATYSENLTTTVLNNVTNYAWTVAASQATTQARIRIQVEDDTGNVGEDFSDANFTISSADSAISYAVGDPDSDTVNLVFREPIYTPSGSLGTNSFTSTNVSLSTVTHTAGDSSATVLLTANLGSDNIDIATLQPTVSAANSSFYFSKNSDGSAPYVTGTPVAAVNVQQLSVEPLGVSYTTATSNLNLFGLRLVGWDGNGGSSGNNYLLKQINVTIDEVSGIITDADFAPESTDSAVSGIGLFDAAGNALTLDSIPSIEIGSSFGLAYTGNLATTPITGAGNYNFYLGVLTSGNISDSVPDSFKVTIDSVQIEDSTTSDNIAVSYVPHGTRATDAVVADTTPYTTPEFTVDDPINSGNVSAVSLAITGEAGADAHYTFYNEYQSAGNASVNIINTVTGNVVLTGLGIITETLSVNLMAFSGNVTGAVNTNFSVNVSLLDDAGNASTATNTYVYDLDPPTTGSLTAGNVIVSNANVFTFDIDGLEASSNMYSVILDDSMGNVNTFTGSFGGSNTITVDLSAYADGNITYSFTLTDDNGNSSGNISAGNIYKDATAPTITAVDILDLDGNISNLDFNFTIDDLANSTNITYIVSNVSAGNTLTGNVSAANLSGNITVSLATFADGSITVTGNAIDEYGNNVTASFATNTVLLDTTAPDVPDDSTFVNSGNASPIMSWLAISGANQYTVSLYNSSDNLYDSFTTSTNTVDYVTAGNSNTNSVGGNILALDTYSWNVTATDDYSNTSANSANVMFTVAEPSAPTMTAPIGSVTTIADPTFYWNDVVESARFQLEVTSDNTTFTPLFAQGNVTSSQNSFGYSSGNNELYTSSDNYLAAGTYYWRIRTTDIFGYQGSWSTNGVFVVASPAAPALVSPINNNSDLNNADATFSWTSVSDNALISIQVSSDNVTFTPLFAEGNVASSVNSFVFSSGNNDLYTSSENYLSAGDYYWRARTTDIYGNAGSWSGNGEFTVVNPAAPALVTPINNDSGVNNADATFGWTSVSDNALISIQMSSDNAFMTLLAEGNVASSVNSFVFSSGNNDLYTSSENYLSAGNYYWRAKTTDIYGNEGSWSGNGEFSVVNPSAPSLTSPISSAVSSADAMFSWGSVTSADNYTVYLGQDSSGNTWDYTVTISGTSLDYNAMTSNFLAATPTFTTEYYWSVATTDIYGNTGVIASIENFAVEKPDAPASLISPIDREATTATPNFRWSTVTDSVSYYITVTSEDSSFTVSSSNVTTANVILGSSLSDNVYFWSVKSIDQYGNESLSSDNAEFSVNIPMLVYAVGDIDSNEVVAVFNKSVYSNDNETGALLVDNIDVDALGGASQVTHLAGETELTVLTAQELTSGNSSDSLNEVAFGPSTTTVVYGKGGALASTSNVTIRQVSAATNVVTADGLNFGDTDGLEIMSFKVGGWSGSNVKLKAINLVITPLSGSVDTSDFEAQANVLSLSSNGTAIATTLGSASFIGSSQTLTLDTSYEVESDTVSSPNFDLSIVPSSTTSTDSTAKAFKVEIESLLLEIDSADATRLVAGDTETSNVIMTSVTLDTTSTGNLTTDETITITATNASATGTFSWTQLSGTTVDVVNSDSAAMSFEAEVAGTYEFQLSYIRNGYEIVRTVSMDIIEKAQEDALNDLVATAASLTTDEEFNEAFEVFASFSANAVSGQEENLISAANSLLGQLVNVGFNPTSTQLDDLFAVVDNSTSSSTNLSTAAFGAAQDVLESMDELPATAAHAQVGFKVFSKLIEQDTTNLSVSITSTEFNEIVAALGDAASQSLVTSGSKSINVDSSSDVKFSSSRLNSGETTTTTLDAGTTELLSVTLSSDTLAELAAAGAGNSLMLSTSIVQDTTSAANLASKVYSIDVMETDGDTTSAVSVSGLTNGIQIKIVIDNFVASQAYEVRFRSAGDVAFQTDATFVTTVSNGVLTVTTTHLTEFAVFESDAGVSGGGGGGGCLLK